MKLKTWFVIRGGFADNQTPVVRRNKARNEFETGYYRLVAIVKAASREDAEAMALQKCRLLHGQTLNAT